jgi:hypothetical protein
MTELKAEKGPGSAPGPNPVFSQNGASSGPAASALAGASGPIHPARALKNAPLNNEDAA